MVDLLRLADPDHQREAINTRPTLLHSIVRQTTSGGQYTLTITSAKGDKHAIMGFFRRSGNRPRARSRESKHDDTFEEATSITAMSKAADFFCTTR